VCVFRSNVNLKSVRVTIVDVEKKQVLNITCFCLSVSALVIRRLYSAMLYYHLWPVCLSVSYFSTLSHKRHELRIKVIEHKMCALILFATFI